MSECKIPPGGSPGVPRGADIDTHTKGGREAVRRLSDRVPKPAPKPAPPSRAVAPDVKSLMDQAFLMDLPHKTPRNPREVRALQRSVMRRRQHLVDRALKDAEALGFSPDPPRSMRELEALEQTVFERQKINLKEEARARGVSFEVPRNRAEYVEQLARVKGTPKTKGADIKRELGEPVPEARYATGLREDEVGPGSPSSRRYAHARPARTGRAPYLVEFDAQGRKLVRKRETLPDPDSKQGRAISEGRADPPPRPRPFPARPRADHGPPAPPTSSTTRAVVDPETGRAASRRESPAPVSRSEHRELAELFEQAADAGIIRADRVFEPKNSAQAQRWIKELRRRLRDKEVE